MLPLSHIVRAKRLPPSRCAMLRSESAPDPPGAFSPHSDAVTSQPVYSALCAAPRLVYDTRATIPTRAGDRCTSGRVAVFLIYFPYGKV